MNANQSLTGRLYLDKDDEFTGFNNTIFRVTSADYRPFSIKRQHENGSVYFEGVCANIVMALAEILNFQVVWQDVKDGNWGSIDESGQWTGMVGEVQRGEADFAASGITITHSRDTAVDFTYPFWEESLGVMVKTKDTANYLTSMFQPLHFWVWISLAASCIGVSFILRIFGVLIARLDKRDSMCSSFFLCFWYCFGSVFNQGLPFQPKSSAARYLVSIWLLFGVVIYASYTANLIAFLTIDQDTLPFSTLEEMAAQSEYRYGAYSDGAAMSVFNSAKSGLYKEIYNGITSNPGNILSWTGGDDGFEKVRKEKFAYIDDSTWLLLNASNDCSVSLIKEKFYKIGFGIVVPEGWKYKKYFDAVIMHLTESGLVQRWSKDIMYQQGQCGNFHAFLAAHSLTLEHTAGIFILVGFGAFLGLITLSAEVIYHNIHVYYRQKHFRDGKV